MARPSSIPSGFLARAADHIWQAQLRASVCLYLSLNADSTLKQEFDDLLRRSEQELLDYLLAGQPPTPDERQRAQHFLDMAQCQLLSSATDVQLLLAELVDEQKSKTSPLHATVAATSSE